MIRPHRFVRSAGLLAVALAVIVCLMPAPSLAEVHDNAHLFGAKAVTDADAAMAQMQQRHNKGLVIETFATVPVEQQGEVQKDKVEFFKHWSTERANATRATGVYVLICMDPPQVKIRTGPETAKRGDFTRADIGQLNDDLTASLHAHRYDEALAVAVEDVERAYTTNIVGGAPASAARSSAGSSTPFPANVPSIPSSNHGGGGLGTLICVGIGLLIIFALVKSVFGRRNNNVGGGFGGGFGGGNSYGGGGNYPTGGPGYGPGYGAPQQTGGGFGSGFLGGLLGGAVGGYAENRFERRDDPNSNASFGGGGDGGSNFGNSGGGGTPGFDSGPSDVGNFSDNTGGDGGGSFGDSGGGGGDSGGGGGDSGGGDGGGSF